MFLLQVFHCIPCFGFTYFHLMVMELAFKGFFLSEKITVDVIKFGESTQNDVIISRVVSLF